MESLNKVEIGFLKEQITDLKKSMTEGFATLHAKFDILNEQYIKRDEVKEMLRPVKDDLSSLKEDRKWAIRLILGVIITAALGLVLKLNGTI